MPHIGRWAGLVFTLVVAGCAKDDSILRVAADVTGPSIVPVDSLVLREQDSLPLGAFTSFFDRDAAGRTFVNDMQDARLVAFGADGGFLWASGTRGDGPGQYQVPSAVEVVAHGALLAVFDVRRRTLSLVDSRTGAFRRSLPTEFQDVGTNWVIAGDTVLFAPHMAAVLGARWITTSDRVTTLGATPTRLLSAPDVTLRHGRPSIIPYEHGFLVALPATPRLLVLDSLGGQRGQIALPAARRKGESARLFDAGSRGTQAGMGMLGSSLYGLARLASGEIAVVFLDMDVVKGDGGRARFENFKLYLSIVKPDLSAVCVDGMIPVTTDVAPLPVFVGDTLFTLARQVSTGTAVRSVIYGYRVSSEGCEWQPTGGVLPPSPLDSSAAAQPRP